MDWQTKTSSQLNFEQLYRITWSCLDHLGAYIQPDRTTICQNIHRHLFFNTNGRAKQDSWWSVGIWYKNPTSWLIYYGLPISIHTFSHFQATLRTYFKNWTFSNSYKRPKLRQTISITSQPQSRNKLAWQHVAVLSITSLHESVAQKVQWDLPILVVCYL